MLHFFLPAGDSLYSISTATRVFIYQITATLDLAAVTSAVPIPSLRLQLSLTAPNINLDYQHFGAKLPSCVAWSPPVTRSLHTLQKCKLLTDQSDEGGNEPRSSGLIRFEIMGKASTGINSTGSGRKGLLSASWRICIFPLMRDLTSQIKALKPTNHFNGNCETPPATLVRKLPVMKTHSI